MKVVLERVDRIVIQRLMSGQEMSQAGRYATDIAIQQTSVFWLGMIDDEPAVMFGCVQDSFLSPMGYFWLFHTEIVKEHTFTFIRHSQMIVKELLKEYEVIYGHMVAGQERSKAWLTWLGATFSKPENGLVPFEIRAKHG